MSKPTIHEYLQYLFLIVDALQDLFPSFEQRLANREGRVRRRHQEGKISDERLQVELDIITQKREARKENN